MNAAARAVARVAATHPVATYLAVTFTVAWGVLLPLALAGLPPEPGLLVVVFLGMAGPACLITAADGGRAAVRELLGRAFRWRVAPVWYLLAAFGLPVAIVAGALAVRGPGVLADLAADPGVLVSSVSALAVVPLVNLWEETGWMGFVQARLEPRWGVLRGAAATGVLFGALHAPLFLYAGGPRAVLLAAGLTLAFAVPFRIVLGWLYHHARCSVLVVALAHGAFNAANDGPLTLAAWPHAWPTTVAPAVVLVAALLVVAGGVGRADGAGAGPLPAPHRGRPGVRGLPSSSATSRAAAARGDSSTSTAPPGSSRRSA